MKTKFEEPKTTNLMRVKLCKSLSALVIMVLSLISARAQTYSNVLTSLNPAGYWPMHEVEAAAPGDIETNYGSLGLLGTGYYPDYQVNSGAFLRQYPGALANDADPAVFFTGPAGGGTATNGLFVPHTSPLATLKPPFTVECWLMATNIGTGQGDVISQGDGTKTVGFRLYYQNSANDPVNLLTYDGSTSGQLNFSTGSSASNQWHHLVLTCDAGTNMTAWWDGAKASGPSAFAGKYKPDIHMPFTVGTGLGNARAFHGLIDEVAVYAMNLGSADIAQHYSDGTGGGAGAYYYDVTNDNPLIYLRMDSASYAVPAGSWPVLNNYGLTNGVALNNGVYTPGVFPGAVSGPSYYHYPMNLGSLQVAQLSGVSSFANAGDSPAYNPTGTSPFTVSALFRGNPTDTNRVQSIVGHGTNSWELGLTVNGNLVFNSGTNSAAVVATGSAVGDLVSTTNGYDDGNWHQVMAVHNGTTNVLYVDGVANNTNILGAANNAGNLLNLMIGSDPCYTNTPIGLGRQFAGQVCEVAFFTNALTAGQIQNLYTNFAYAALIATQPISSTNNQNTAFTNTMVATGTALVYQWYQSTDGGLTFSPRGGQTNGSLVLNSVQVTDAGEYYVVVTNSYSSVTSVVVTLTVNSSPVFATQLPQSYTNLLTLFAGARPSFSVSAAGAQPLSYYWFTNGLFTGVTNASLALNGQPAGGLTNVYCVASNFVNTTTSMVWTVSVIPAPTAPYPQSVMNLNPAGFWRMNEPDDGLGDYNPGAICHDYAGGNNGIYTNAALGQPGYNSDEPSETAAGFGASVFQNSDAYGIAGIDFSSPTNTSRSFTVEAWVNGYQETKAVGLVSKGWGGGGEQFDLDTGGPTNASQSIPNNFRFLVRDAAGTVHAVNSSVQPSFGTWQYLVGVCDEVNGVVTFYIDGQSIGATTISPGGGILSSAYPMIIGSRASSLANQLAGVYDDQFVGSVDDVAVYDYAVTPAQVLSNYVSIGVAPLLTQVPPGNTNLYEGATLTLPATVIGTPPLGYQWTDLSANTTLAAGVTNNNTLNASLTIPSVPLAWNGEQLQLTVTNAFGTNSVYVSISVSSSAPQILTNLPPSVYLIAGQAYTNTVSVIGTLPLSYFWYSNNVLVAGASGPSLAIPSVPAGSSTYYVMVTNIDGPATSVASTVMAISLAGSYSSDISGLSPAGYWPLQETNAPAAATVETNYGNLGDLGNGYYAGASAADVTLGVGGALTNTGDNDAAAEFTGTPSSFLFIPRVSPALTVKPPFSVECWLNSTSTGFGDLIGEGGSGLNSVPGAGNAGGFRLSYGGNQPVGPNLQLYIYNGNGLGRPSIATANGSLATNMWHHCVATFDGTTATLYVDGAQEASGTFTMATDTWSPLTIGAGWWQGVTPQRAYVGSEDEVAVYDSVLSAAQITNHWLAGTTSGSNYVQTILNDDPLLYYRMDCPAYTNVPNGLCPVATNYGTVPVNGAYLSGTQPGTAAGPSAAGLIGEVATPINGVTAAVDAGFTAAFDPTGTQPFSALCWFKGNPADDRLQTLMSQGTDWSLNLEGTNGTVVWSNGAGSVASTNVLNDGDWHFVVGVYDGIENYLYVDGELNNSAPISGSLSGDGSDDLYLGGNAAFTGGTVQQYFAGSIAQAAFFTNALTASIIQPIYQAAITSTVNTAPTNLLVAVTGNQVTLSWPADHTGWRLQAQTNSLNTGLGGGWFDVSGSTSVDQVVVPINPRNGCVFYRLVYP